jgi:hypothetical protein
MNRYRVLLPLTVHTADGAYTQGEEFEQDFSHDDEATNLASGLLEIVPQRYEVVGGCRVHETEPGDVFERALTVGEEALLVAGGHVRRVESAPPKSKQKKEAKK